MVSASKETTGSSTATDFRYLPLSEMEEICDKFEKKVWGAQLTSPPSRQLLKDTVCRTNTLRCPTWLRRVTPDLIIRHGDGLMELFEEFPDDLARVSPYDLMVGYKPKNPISPVAAMMLDSEWINEWGVGWKHIIGGVGATEVSNALPDWSGLDEYLANVFPKADEPGRLSGAAAPAKALRAADKYIFGLFGSAFYHAFSIRGMENLMMDMYEHPKELQRLIDALLDYALKLVKGWSEIGVDALLVLDDWGTQQRMLISPNSWREFFKPAYKTLFEEIHKYGMDTMMHTCGNVMEIIDDLIEIGLDVLDPIQTSAMDISELASRFGGRITFCGTIDVQRLLPSARPQEIKDTIHRTIDTLAAPFGYGLILAPTNTITPDVPLENLRAMFEVCHEYRTNK